MSVYRVPIRLCREVSGYVQTEADSPEQAARFVENQPIELIASLGSWGEDVAFAFRLLPAFEVNTNS